VKNVVYRFTAVTAKHLVLMLYAVA